MPEPSPAQSHTKTASRCGEDRVSISLPVLATPAKSTGPKIKRSKRGPLRAAVLIAVHVFMIAHIIQWQLQGDTISPVEPSDSMKTLVQGMVNAGTIFFAVAILSTLIFGRFFCGWGCHLVAMQDACGWFMKKLGVRPKPFRTRILVWAPVVFAFYMFAWPNFSRFIYEPIAQTFFPKALQWTGSIVPFPAEGLTNHIVTEDYWAYFPTIYVAIPFLLVCGFATVYFLGAKGLCTYACPYGGVFGPVDRISPGRIVVDHDRCHQCGHCTAVCTSNVRVHDEIREFGMVVDAGCMKCLDCVSVCPNEALSFKFAKPAVLKGKPKNAAPRRHYDVTLREDIALAFIMLGCFLALRGPAFPALFAAGTAAILAFVFFKLWRTLIDRDVRLMTFQLRRAGKLTRAGLGFVALASLALVLTIHSGYVNYHAGQGDKSANQLMQYAALAATPGRQPFPEDIRSRAREGLEHYAVAASFNRGGISFADTNATLQNEALLHLILDEPARTEALYKRMLDRSGPMDTIIVNQSRVMRMQGKNQEADALLESTLRDNPRFWNVRHELANIKMAMGTPEPSIAEAEAALKIIPNTWKTRDARARTRLTLALLYNSVNRGSEALNLLREAVAIRPRDGHLRDTLAGALAQISNDLPGAIEQLRIGTRVEPSRIELWDRLVQFSFAAGDTEGAYAALEHLVKVNKLDPNFREMIAQQLEQSGHADLAERLRRDSAKN